MTRATIATEIGDIEVELFDQAAPKATKNFVDLASNGFYDDVIFHRVIPGFVIQGGDGQYGKKSALERSREWLLQLHAEGRAAARRFLRRHGADLGRRETLDVSRVFAGDRKPKMRLAAAAEAPAEPAGLPV